MLAERNRLGTQKTIRNDVSHIEFKQTIKKLYKQDICGGDLGFLFLCAFPAENLQGCPPRLYSWVYVEIISTGQPFTARHVHQTLPALWVLIVSYRCSSIHKIALITS